MDPPSYNIAPTHKILVIVKDGIRTMMAMRWGLVPSWSDTIKIGAKMINARSNTNFKTLFL